MSNFFVANRKKIVSVFLFTFLCGVILTTSGCGMWKKPWKNPWGKADSHHAKYGKELPDAPLYTGRSQDELIDQAAFLRRGETQAVVKEEKKPWYKRTLWSPKASEIDEHLGE